MLTASPLTVALLKHPMSSDADHEVPGTPELSSPLSTIQSARGLSPDTERSPNVRRAPTPGLPFHSSGIARQHGSTSSPLLRGLLSGNSNSSIQNSLGYHCIVEDDSEVSTEEDDEFDGIKRKLSQRSSLHTTVSLVPEADPDSKLKRVESDAKKMKPDREVPSPSEVTRKLPDKRAFSSKTLDLFGENDEIFANSEE